ncbi:FliG C-terminal domain-containing protein [Treponema sp. R8-4-B8]
MYKQTMNQPSENSATNVPAKRSTNNTPAVFYKESKKQKPPIFVPEGETPQESKYRRVAKFLILIGSEQAAGILAELDPEQVSEISKEIASINIIKPDERDQILIEFHSLFSRPYNFSGSSQGGIETARRILYAVKGPIEGEELLNRAIPKTKENLFGFLEEFSAEQLVMLLKDETDQTAALILSRMTAKLSAETLSKLPSHRKAVILKRIAHQSEVAPEVLEQVSAALREKIRHVSAGSNDIKIDGMQALTAILKHGDYSFGDKLINEIVKDDPKIGQNLKEKLYTLDDVLLAVDRPIQDKLSTMTDRDIAILLKGRGNEFYEKIMSCVSAGRRKSIREENEILGAVLKRDCDSVAKEFLTWFRYARENGEILLYSDEDVVL